MVWGRVTDWTDSFCEIGLPLYGLLLRARALGSPQPMFCLNVCLILGSGKEALKKTIRPCRCQVERLGARRKGEAVQRLCWAGPTEAPEVRRNGKR